MSAKTKINERDDDSSEDLVCKQCNKSYTLQKHYDNHLLNDHGVDKKREQVGVDNAVNTTKQDSSKKDYSSGSKRKRLSQAPPSTTSTMTPTKKISCCTVTENHIDVSTATTAAATTGGNDKNVEPRKTTLAPVQNKETVNSAGTFQRLLAQFPTKPVIDATEGGDELHNLLAAEKQYCSAVLATKAAFDDECRAQDQARSALTNKIAEAYVQIGLMRMQQRRMTLTGKASTETSTPQRVQSSGSVITQSHKTKRDDGGGQSAPATVEKRMRHTTNSNEILVESPRKTKIELNERVAYNREHGQIKFTWPQRDPDSGKIVLFLVHWIGSDCLVDFTYEQPDDYNLNELAYKQMLSEIPDVRYMWDSFEELEELRERFKRTPTITWQQVLIMDVNELWRGSTNAARRTACEAKRSKLIDGQQQYIAAVWHLDANIYLVHWRANKNELDWNKDEFEWLAHGFAVINDQRLHSVARTSKQRIYPWSDGKQALQLINDQTSKNVLEYDKKQTIATTK